MKTPFKTSFVDGKESVMTVDGLSISEIRYNQVTREIIIISNDDKYTLEDLDHLSWQEIKKLVVENDGEWNSKSSGIEYLIGRAKNVRTED